MIHGHRKGSLRVGIVLGIAATIAACAVRTDGGVSGSGVAPSGSPAGADGPSGTGLRYVALGDSYTIGTSVAPAERWPEQLVERLGATTPTLTLVANLGVNGYTSADVIRAQLSRLDELRPEFATLLIGVNDVVQGVPAATFERNAGMILDALLARLPADRIVTTATPDYTVTPAGADYGDPAEQHAGIVRNNAILERLARQRGIAYVDTFDISLEAATDRSLVAGDGLHPSGAQYTRWVERIAPVVERLIGR
ncbi:MAG: SGNH/GDSL hydrolase family protein [Candidatus Limnocylindrales bacterium]